MSRQRKEDKKTERKVRNYFAKLKEEQGSRLLLKLVLIIGTALYLIYRLHAWFKGKAARSEQTEQQKEEV